MTSNGLRAECKRAVKREDVEEYSHIYVVLIYWSRLTLAPP